MILGFPKARKARELAEARELGRRLDKSIRGIYEPGDVIVKEGPNVHYRYVVDDPPRTVNGKLRLRRPQGTILTTWWGRGPGDPSWLPKYYRREWE